MQLTIKNNDVLNAWMNERKVLGHDMVAIKGPAPTGSTYSDDTLIIRPVNIRWKDVVTGEVCDIDYSK